MADITTIPTFAIVGQPNEGKTSVIATLAENDRILIGPVPGMTRRLTRHPVRVDDDEIMVLYDTPGFESPGACLEWLQGYKGQENPASAFVNFRGHREKYPEECEILQPLANGAAVIYVVDGDREPREPDRQEAKILRLCGVARIGVINSKGGVGRYVPEWKKLMLKDFNTLREFNACNAVFADRIELLQAAESVVPDWRDSMQTTVAALCRAWEERLENAAEIMLDGMERVIKFRAKAHFDSDAGHIAAKKKAKLAVEVEVRSTEDAFRERILKLFRHHDDHWDLPKNLEADIFSDEVWRCLGMDKKKLILTAAVTGASSTVLIDYLLGGASLGVFALAGGVTFGAGAWMTADNVVRYKLPSIRLGPIRIPGVHLGGTYVEAGIERRSKLPGILLERMLLFILSAASWAHAKREDGIIKEVEPSDEIDQGVLNSWSKDDRVKVMTVIEVLHRLAEGKSLSSTDVDTAENEFRNTIARILKQQTMGRAVQRLAAIAPPEPLPP